MVKILRLAAVFLLMGLPFFCAQAQSGFIEASIWSNVDPSTGLSSDFIIKPDGTKLFGEIQKAFDVKDYEQVIFESNDGVKTYLPADLKAFGLGNGRFFMSKILPESTELEFVEILFSGKLQLDYRKGAYYIDNGLEIIQLRSYYKDYSVDGTERRRNVKLYIATLKILTSGKCGFDLIGLIERARLEGQDLIQILTQYHKCENLAYRVHVEKVPLVKISPTLGAGLGTVFISSYDNGQGRASRINRSIYIQSEVGIRFHDFRKSPRFSLDLRLGYSLLSSTWEISQNNLSSLITGTQDFKQTSVSVPISFNYSFFKKNDRDIYFGLKSAVIFNSIKAETGFIDFTYLGAKETYLSEMEILNVDKLLFMPGAKLGGNFPIGQKRIFYTELHTDYSKRAYMTSLPNYDDVGYNSVSVSINVGIQF